VLKVPIQRSGTRPVFIQSFVDPNESIRIREGQWTQEHAFHDREDRSVCTDPERERQDRDQSKPGRFKKLAKSELEVVHVITVIIQHEGR